MVPNAPQRPPISLVAFDADMAQCVLEALCRQSLHGLLCEPSHGLLSGTANSPTPSSELTVLCGPSLSVTTSSAGSCAQTCLVLTCDNSPQTRASWLDWGAEDCLTYPCSDVELAARLRALQRRFS
jgi:hypothetical protein